ncbi:MAG: site-specific integrase [Methanobacterium sp.]|uniref:tyrosine-type recombinase/integrase n=1 Tax=Methanobacterium sp. TaxID=2164 RepID=UPI003D661CB0|nr:site-specific integrase [Methanobacterium sp.]
MFETNRKITVVDEPIFQDFCIERDIRESSIKGYKYALQKYSNFTNKTLEELIDEAEEENDSSIKLRKRKITKYLRNYKLRLEELDMADKSRKQNMVLVTSFYRYFDIDLPKSNGRKSRNLRKLQTIDDLPTMDEIQRFLEYCNSTYKAIVLTGLSSGMGSAEKASLTFEHFFKAIDMFPYPETLPEIIDKAKAKGNIVLKWYIIRIKTGNPYFTFSSPESLDRIIIYLEELHHKHPEYNPKPKDRLFRSIYSNKPLKPNNMCSMFNYINRTKGFRRVDNHYVIKNHTLRKYFATTLENMKVPHLTTRKLMGHNIDSVTNTYFKTDVEILKKDYLEALDKLTTNKVQIKVIDKNQELKDEFDSLKALVLKSGNLFPEQKDLYLKEELKEQLEFDKRYANDKAFREDLLEKEREYKLNLINNGYNNAVG